jgi:membrane associated rhomboid family serine protease
MGRPLLLDAWERPATTVVCCVCCAVWWYLNSRGLGYEDVGVSYRKAVRERQLWRCVTASFSHVSFVHLLFNMSSLWSLGVVEQMGSRGAGWGTVWYARYTLVMLVGTMALVLATTHVLVRYAKLDKYDRVTSVGYSCVVFGWMTYVAVKGAPSGVLSLFGAARVPVNLAPFGSLLFTSLVVPQASFIGHLAGIVIGYLVAWDAFKWLDTESTSLLLLGTVAVGGGDVPKRIKRLRRLSRFARFGTREKRRRVGLPVLPEGDVGRLRGRRAQAGGRTRALQAARLRGER